MDIQTIENSITLLAIIIALLGCLFRYIDHPNRDYLYLCVYFLAHLLSDYYWTVYTLVMNVNPDISAFVAYFGWNVGYLVLALAAIHTRDEEAKRYFHPLMLIPIPLNIAQFMLYMQFGGIFNNLWSGVMLTAVAMICIQSLLYWFTHRKDGAHFCYLHLAMLLFILSEYGMWTSSCFAWPQEACNPYYYFELINCVICMFLGWAAGRDHEIRGRQRAEKSVDEIRFQVRIRVLVSIIIFGVCTGGYYFALWMKGALPENTGDGSVYNIIAVMLFVLSIFLVLIILAVLYVIALRYRMVSRGAERSKDEKRNRFNLVLTLLITLGLMIFSVAYNCRLYYVVSVDRIYELGNDKATTTADEIENYLTVAYSTLRVTAETVDLMDRNNEAEEKIRNYLVSETDNLKHEFDENFTGIYGYINGIYMDGAGWTPPEGYDATKRDWYQAAVNAGGRAVIVSPYIDAQTGEIVVTIARMLTDSRDVVALDVIANHVQDVTQQVDIGGRGYAMIVNEDDLVVAHRDQTFVGRNLAEIASGEFVQMLHTNGEGRFDSEINGEDSTFFISKVMDQWYVVIVVNRMQLLEDVRSQLTINILVSLAIFSLISLFYYLGYKNEQAYSRKVEEMKASRQKQEYEAEVLRLEKMAADEANRAKSGFLADMSHEIRTPINAILGMNEMILRETGETETLSYAKNIKSSGRNLLELINSILDFSKIEDGKMEITPVRYNVNSLITYLINSVRERAADKNLKLEVDVDPSMPSELYGDDAKIEQIVLNLLTNAVKYTHEGSVTLTVRVKETKDDSALVYVEVKDTGIGIREEDMGRLFETFERLDIVRNRNIEGTGLGLAIVTRLLTAMDSKLDVSSVYGQGSVFSFELWQKIENAEPLGEYKIAAISGDDLHTYRESFTAPDAKILVVDDTKMNIIVVQNLLKTTGITCDTAESGAQALELCSQNHYDVILLDQRMPGMDGTETLKEMRKDEKGPNIDTPVICLTADAVRGAKERYISQGFSAYLTKPVEGRELERVLIRFLPEDKVIKTELSDDDRGREDSGSSEEFVEALEREGFDTAAALGYCQHDSGLYHSVLASFAQEYPGKSANISRYYDEKNWNDYSVLVHSVKSSAKTIGAMQLSEKAAALEKASKENDSEVVFADHDEMMKEYQNICHIIEKNIRADEDPSADVEVLEFAPEGDD